MSIITVRDGKQLNVEQCLHMTRHAYSTWATDNHTPDNPTAGMALALEAALLRVQQLEHELEQEKVRRRRRRWLG
jgi:hypothetical protein